MKMKCLIKKIDVVACKNTEKKRKQPKNCSNILLNLIISVIFNRVKV